MRFLGMICLLLVVWVENGLAYGPPQADLGDLYLRSLINQINSHTRHLKSLQESLQEMPDELKQSDDYQERLDEVNKELERYTSELAKRLQDHREFMSLKAGINDLTERIERLQEFKDELPETSPRYKEDLEQLTKEIKGYSGELEWSKMKMAELLKKPGFELDITGLLTGPQPTSDRPRESSEEEGYPARRPAASTDGFTSLAGDCPGAEKDIKRIPANGRMSTLGVDGLIAKCARVCKQTNECKGFLFVAANYPGAPYCWLKSDSCVKGLSRTNEPLEFYRKN